MKRYLGKLLALALAASFVLSGCGQAATPTATPAPAAPAAPAAPVESAAPADPAAPAEVVSSSDTFIYGVEGDPGTNVNVVTTGDRMGLSQIKLTNSPLFMYNSSDDIEYFLAERVEPSADFMSYTAYLRDGVLWHDGQPFSADDVVFTYEQMVKEDSGSWARDQLVIDGKPITIEKLDNLTVKFTFPVLNMAGMESIANVFIMPKHIYEGETDFENSPKNARPIGTGPYKLIEQKIGDYVKFEANENYFLGAPKIKNVFFKVTTDPNTAQLALQSGEIHALAPIAPADVVNLSKNDSIAVYPYSENRVGYMAFNLQSDLVKDKAVREAILYAINKQELIIAGYVSADFADEAISFLPRNAGYYTENVPSYTFDLEKAKELAKSSGADTKTFRIAYANNNKINAAQGAVMQQHLKAAGITLELTPMDIGALIERMDSGTTDYDMYFSGYIMGIDPDTYATLFTTGSDSNYMRYSNTEVDKLFADGKVETDLAKRQAIYERIQELIIGDAAYYPIQENKRILAMNKAVAGVEEASLVPVYTFEDMSKLYFK